MTTREELLSYDSLAASFPSTSGVNDRDILFPPQQDGEMMSMPVSLKISPCSFIHANNIVELHLFNIENLPVPSPALPLPCRFSTFTRLLLQIPPLPYELGASLLCGISLASDGRNIAQLSIWDSLKNSQFVQRSLAQWEFVEDYGKHRDNNVIRQVSFIRLPKVLY